MNVTETAHVAVPFPEHPPAGYQWLAGEPPFDPDRHLALEPPAEVVTLAELGYPDAEIEPTATPVAVSAPFRVLSDEGAAVMQRTARALRARAKRAGNRIENVVRSGCYRSRWLRDLCLSPAVTEAMAGIYGVGVAPHTMPVHLGHLNYEPANVHEAVDKWHHDTIALDYVMMVTDPAQLPGGRFEYFPGHEGRSRGARRRGEDPAPGPGRRSGLPRPRLRHRPARQHGGASRGAPERAGRAHHHGQRLRRPGPHPRRPEPFPRPDRHRRSRRALHRMGQARRLARTRAAGRPDRHPALRPAAGSGGRAPGVGRRGRAAGDGRHAGRSPRGRALTSVEPRPYSEPRDVPGAHPGVT